MEQHVKTLRFWLTEIGVSDFALLHDLSRTLAQCHQTFTFAALVHVQQGKPANNECLRLARRAYQEEFGKSVFVRRFGNTYTGDIAFKDFKRQWGLIRTGQKSSVSFGPGKHANITFLTGATGTQANLQRVEDDWWLTGAQIVKDEGTLPRTARRWKLVPQTNRGSAARGRQARRTMEQMNAALTRNMVRLVWREKRGWEAQVVVTLPVVVGAAKEAVTCGVKVGMRHLLVASIPTARRQWWFGEQHGKALWQALDKDHERRRTLYKAHKRNAARAQGNKCGRLRNHLCELASRQLVDWLMVEGIGKLRMEKLTGIRERTLDELNPQWNRRMSNWPWFALQQKIEQKCAAVGIEVEFVDPTGTSQTCSNCSFRHAENRNAAQFLCKRCGFTCHANLNAANNIARAGAGQDVDFDAHNPSRAAVRLDRPKARPQEAQLAPTVA